MLRKRDGGQFDSRYLQLTGTRPCRGPAIEVVPGGSVDRVSMREVREVLRLHFECVRSQREIARSLVLRAGTVSDNRKRARAAELDWATASALSEAEIHNRLIRQAERPARDRAAVDFAMVHQELKRVIVTLQLQLLWVEYQEAVLAHADGSEPYAASGTASGA